MNEIGVELQQMPDLDTEQTRMFDRGGGSQLSTPGSFGGMPRRVGDYLIHGQLGEGGMGKVYAAEECLTKRRVALKVLHGELAQSERGRRQFVTEMSVLASLDNPHVVRCLRGAEIDGELVMVLEYLEGETLRARLARDGAFPWEEAVEIARQIAIALDAAHCSAQPIIHRDLKPENVMLVRGGQVKVMDFGIAKVLQTIVENTTHSVGTLRYMSPEQIDARPIDARSDLFALGLVLWELLAGYSPFRAETPRLLLDQICTTPTPPLPENIRGRMPRGIEEIVGQLLEKDPRDRPASAADVIHRLAPLCPRQRSDASARSSAAVSVQPMPIEGLHRRRPAPTPLNTVDIIENQAGPRWVPLGQAIMIILGSSVGAGLVTWVIYLLIL